MDGSGSQDCQSAHEVTVEHTGFAKYVRGPIMLLLNQDAVVNPALQVAAATEVVIVTEDALEGKRALALNEMDQEALKYADLQPFAALDAAEVYAVLGETDRAIEWLDRSMRKGDDRAAWLRIDPLLANVRQHPRFKQILNSMEFRRQQRIALPAKQL